MLALPLGLAALTEVQPTQAAEYSALKKYFSDTEGMIEELNGILDANPDDPTSMDRFKAFKKNSSRLVPASATGTAGTFKPTEMLNNPAAGSLSTADSVALPGHRSQMCLV